MSNSLTAAVLAVTYASLFLLERALPLRRAKARLAPRLFVNVAITAVALAAAAGVVRPTTLWALGVAETTSSGLIALAGLDGLLEVAAAFLLLDLTFYYWHVANHRSGFLWRFHNVHHIDPDLDVSTAFRFHFVEVVLSAAFRAVQVLVIGPSLTAYLVYETAFLLGTLFHHSNLRMPAAAEQLLNSVVVTPRMHGIHHSDLREENLANFGVVFSWWDRLHRSLRLNVPQAEITIGIAGYSERRDNTVVSAFVVPFQRQRNYWRGRLRRQPP